MDWFIAFGIMFAGFRAIDVAFSPLEVMRPKKREAWMVVVEGILNALLVVWLIMALGRLP